MTEKYYPKLLTCSMLYQCLGRVLSQDLIELLTYVKYIGVIESLSVQNVWAKNIVDSISTTLSFFL
jgi:hypothetical protein